MKSAALSLALVLAACTSARAPTPAAPTPTAARGTLVPAAATTPAPALPPAFAASLARAHLRFEVPAGFRAVAPVDNPHWQYAFAMQALDGSVEVRIRVDDLAAMAATGGCAGRAGCVDTDPAQMWRPWHYAIAANIGGADPTHLPRVEELAPEEVARDFNGDGAVLALVEVDPAFAAHHGHAVVATIHKAERADATVVLLFDDPADVDFERAFGGLRFE